MDSDPLAKDGPRRVMRGHPGERAGNELSLEDTNTIRSTPVSSPQGPGRTKQVSGNPWMTSPGHCHTPGGEFNLLEAGSQSWRRGPVMAVFFTSDRWMPGVSLVSFSFPIALLILEMVPTCPCNPPPADNKYHVTRTTERMEMLLHGTLAVY
ncbi:hypothetical protein DPEC_G00110940 [Dallia pectoralis]|uniref:Uncharacterized protein n=1 Tax=Dallia pectoralis TaxID=75939 RepID=A0ACC2GT25_DALPE|nr:hypothetical protein DPEC_G00110940 [Dallia pectoralis]